MEAIAAVSLAGTVCSLVDISVKIVSQTWSLYKASDGVRTQYPDVEHLASALNSGIEFLKAEQVLVEGSIDSPVQDLSSRATAVIEELLELLGSLRVQDGKSKTRCLKAVLKGVRKRDRVSELRKKLKTLSVEAQMQQNILLIKQNHQQMSIQTKSNVELKQSLNQHYQEIKALMLQGYRRPKEYGYEWEQGEYIIVDDGLGPRFPFPLYLCSNIGEFLSVLRIKFSSRNLPGLEQIGLGHIEILDSAGMKPIHEQDWDTEVTAGALLRISFVMGRFHSLNFSKCVRCFKPYKKSVSNCDWKECQSCGLTLRLVPPDAYPYEPVDITVGLHPDTYRDHKLGRRERSQQLPGAPILDANIAIPDLESKTPREQGVAGQKCRANKLEDNPALDLVCRRLIIKWEPTINFVHRYLWCRCVVRLSTPSRFEDNPEKTLLVHAICPRHNNEGIVHKDYGDLVNNRVDPYFAPFGGYDCFRAMVFMYLPNLELVGGDAFIDSNGCERALEVLQGKVREIPGQLEEAGTQYLFENFSELQDQGVLLREDIARQVNAWREEREQEREQDMISTYGCSFKGSPLESRDWNEIPMLRELMEIVDGKWNGVLHWSIPN
ncbi:hypothetical protein F5B20DRAFT_559509 [Whalleya microplaca]|nr:hypothetical protein F5B20DRAFT_559509 [Whalleya microplaca]